MKTQSNDEEIVRVGLNVPRWIWEAVKKTAIAERRSASDQAIRILEEKVGKPKERQKEMAH